MSMHQYVELAKKAIAEYITTKKVLAAPGELNADMKQKSGVFVCLKKHGELCGCIGTFLPAAPSLYEEIVRNAIAAATEDPRFYPVQARDLEHLQCSVDVLSAPERVKDVSELDPKKYGIIVSKDLRRGLLLPDLEGVDTVEEQLRITKMKAGIDPLDSNVEIYRFVVERYK